MMTKNECRTDFYIGLGGVAFALVYLLLADSQIDPETDGYDNISGRTFPYIIGAAIFLISCVTVFRSWQRSRTAVADQQSTWDMARLKRAAAYALIIVLYCLAMTHVGYIVSTFVALVVCMWFSGAKMGMAFWITALIVPGLMYYTFAVLMQIPIPQALLF